MKHYIKYKFSFRHRKRRFDLIWKIMRKMRSINLTYDFENVKIDEAKVCVSVFLFVCMSLASGSSETVKVIIATLGSVVASYMKMHYVQIILTLTFTQGHTYHNHENRKYLNISETIQSLPI